MSAKKIFWDDPYRTTLTTTVTSVQENAITLKETIFFAFSGGQESDRGTIGGIEVLEAKKIGTEIFYALPEGHDLKSGDTVTVEIDEIRRLALMRLHFAAELVLTAVQTRHGEWVNRIIAEDHPIESAFTDETAERRVWRIEGVGETPCGGTHLRRTGEIGPVQLRRRNIGGGRERIEITLERL